jgi:hypothetical protein
VVILNRTDECGAGISIPNTRLPTQLDRFFPTKFGAIWASAGGAGYICHAKLDWTNIIYNEYMFIL